MPPLLHPLADALDHEPRFVHFVVGVVNLDRFAVGVGGPQIFAQPRGVVSDERVRRLEDIVGGTVVLLQTDGLGAGEILGEALDILDFRASPPVDALIVVADDKHVALAAAQQPDPVILNGVGILELVHQHMLEPLPVMGQQVRIVAPQFVDAQQQFAEIHQPAALALLLVNRVDLSVLALDGLTVVGEIGGTLAFVLAAVDETGGLRRRPFLLVQIQPAHDPLQQSGLIVAVENLKGAG